jgi:deoxyribodipyrimidine photo-lyase
MALRAKTATAVKEASLVWFRQDLRLDDNPALQAAIERDGAIVCVYIWAPAEEGDWPPGAASRWWLHQSLKSLDAQLQARGSKLILAQGNSLEALKRLCAETHAKYVHWNRRYEPAAIARDTRIKAALTTAGINANSFNGSLLFEPMEIQNNQGSPYKVFTQFWRKCLSRPEPAKPLRAPEKLKAPPRWPASQQLDDFKLLPRIHWTATMEKTWTPGERGAAAQLKLFSKRLAGYAETRNLPGIAGTSRLSPHLHFGEISPRQIWHTLAAVRKRDVAGLVTGEEAYVREIGWREFAHHLLYHFPNTPNEPLRSEFRRFAWAKNAAAFKAWQRGLTGFPIVDAGMRELWATGWMHNRVRMIVASFLIKDLLIPWQSGARWFWETLVDADLANNTLGWQWVAGCGADAAPFFRIFNPTTQSEKFDPKGAYIRLWVPELSALPSEFIHDPSAAPPLALHEAGVVIGRTYPRPIVNHAQAREAALSAFQQLRD